MSYLLILTAVLYGLEIINMAFLIGATLAAGFIEWLIQPDEEPEQ